jgi:hypothetical protein
MSDQIIPRSKYTYVDLERTGKKNGAQSGGLSRCRGKILLTDIGTPVIQASQDLDVHIIPFIIYRGGINWRGPRTPTII